jgi:hypothetical protein
MVEALEKENDPLVATLEHVIPGLHQWHSVNNSAVVSKLTQSVDNLSSNVNHGIQDIFDAMKKERELADQRLAKAFCKLASAYKKRAQPLDTKDLYEAVVNEMPPVPTTTNMQEESPLGAEQNEEEPYRKGMIPKHQSLVRLWNEWNRLDEFEDEYGGICGREKQFGSKWRNCGKVYCQHFSRTKRVIKAINFKLERDHV